MAAAILSGGPAQVIKIDVDVKQLYVDLREAINQIKDIQTLVSSFIDSIVVRKHDETEKETQVIKSTINQVLSIRKELDKLGNKYAKLRLHDIHAVPLGNTGYVCLDPMEEQNGFYKDLIESYRWVRNLDQDCTQALNTLKRKHCGFENENSKKICYDGDGLIGIVETMLKSFSGLIFNPSRLFSEQCLEVKVSGVLVVCFFFSGTTVTNCVVKSIEEGFLFEPNKPSQYQVFQKLTDVFISVILCSLNDEPDVLLRKLLNYTRRYVDFFKSKCNRCHKHLNMESSSRCMLPPVYLDMDSNLFFHLACRN